VQNDASGAFSSATVTGTPAEVPQMTLSITDLNLYNQFISLLSADTSRWYRKDTDITADNASKTDSRESYTYTRL